MIERMGLQNYIQLQSQAGGGLSGPANAPPATPELGSVSGPC